MIRHHIGGPEGEVTEGSILIVIVEALVLKGRQYHNKDLTFLSRSRHGTPSLDIIFVRFQTYMYVNTKFLLICRFVITYLFEALNIIFLFQNQYLCRPALVILLALLYISGHINIITILQKRRGDDFKKSKNLLEST